MGHRRIRDNALQYWLEKFAEYEIITLLLLHADFLATSNFNYAKMLYSIFINGNKIAKYSYLRKTLK